MPSLKSSIDSTSCRNTGLGRSSRGSRPGRIRASKISWYAVGPEDIVLAKLEWYRLGGETSDRQCRDIIDVQKTRAGDLDYDYMQKWASDLNVADLLARA